MDDDSKKALFATLKEIWHKMDVQYELYAKSVGLNFTAILVIQLLHDSTEAYTQKELCEKLILPKQLIHSIIKSFWEQGFVKLQETENRRIKSIIVTDEGRGYFSSVLKPLEDAESSAWESFPDEEFAAFVKTMERYAISFENALTEQRNRE